MNNPQSEFRRATKWRFISQLIYLPASFLTSVILVRYLSPVDYGNYRIVLSLSGILIYIVSLGIQHSISRFIPEFIVLRNRYLIKQLVDRLALIRFLVVAAVVILLNVFKVQFIDFFNLPDVFLKWLWLISIFYILAHTAIVFGQYFHSAVLDMRAITIHDSIKPVLLILLIALTAALDLGFAGVLLALLLCELFSFVFYFASYRVHTAKYQVANRAESQPLPSINWQRIIHYSLHSALYTFGGLAVGTYIDSFVIAKFLDVSRVAFYTFGLMVVMIVHSLNPITLFKNIMSNILVRKYTVSPDDAVFQIFFALSSKLGMFVSLPSFLILCVLVGPVITLVYKADYLYAAPVIYVFSIMLLSRSFSYGLSAIITTRELVKYLNFYYVIALYNMISSVIMVQIWGILGVALATCSAEVVWCFYLLYVVMRKARVKIKLSMRSMVIITVNACVVSLLAFYVRPLVDSIIVLALTLIFLGVLYMILSFLTKPFEKEERSLINGLIGKQLWQF